MNEKRTIVFVLRGGGDYTFQDVILIVKHITMKWKGENKPRLICLWDKASEGYDLSNLELIPLANEYPGTWARLELYGPDMEQYRPFLYVDLDTAIIQSLENIFDLVKDESKYIVLEDFWQKGQLATPLVWFPANSNKISAVWDNRDKAMIGSFRMDYYLRTVITPDIFWQTLTDTIVDFKPKEGKYLMEIKEGTNAVCFHGKPRINEAYMIKWVEQYINA